MLAAGKVVPPSVSVYGNASVAAAPGITPRPRGGFVNPQPVPYAATISPPFTGVKVAPGSTPAKLLETAFDAPQFNVTCTATGPGGSVGTCTLIWPGYAPSIAAGTPSKLAHTPAKLVGTLPFTRSDGTSV